MRLPLQPASVTDKSGFEKNRIGTSALAPLDSLFAQPVIGLAKAMRRYSLAHLLYNQLSHDPSP
jgi:hypothetical protein